MIKQLVVARYEEDVSWLQTQDCFDKIVIYNKSTTVHSSQLNTKELFLPNVERGREAHTWIFHIVKNYYCLADVTVFVQGNPFDHLKILPENLNAEFKKLSWDTIDFEPLFYSTQIKAGEMACRVYNEILLPPVSELTFNWGSQCIVSKSYILSKSLDFYKFCLMKLSTPQKNILDNPFNGWTFEPLWQHIFNPNTKEKIDFKQILD